MSRSKEGGKAKDRQSFKPAMENQGTYPTSLAAGICRGQREEEGKLRVPVSPSTPQPALTQLAPLFPEGSTLNARV